MATYFNHFGDVVAALDGVIDLIIDKTVVDAEWGYKVMIAEFALFDTGNMFNSCFSVTSKRSNYSDGPEREPPPARSDKHQGFAGIAASYAIYHNYGTVHLPAKPFFEPTNEKVGQSMGDAVDAAIRGLTRFDE